MLARVKKLTVAMTKTQVFSDIAENTALTRRQVADVFEALESVIERHVQKGAVGTCTIPGLMKIKVVMKPAQRARKNVPNPFRPGETMDVKAKPGQQLPEGSAAQEAERHGVGVRRTGRRPPLALRTPTPPPRSVPRSRGPAGAGCAHGARLGSDNGACVNFAAPTKTTSRARPGAICLGRRATELAGNQVPPANPSRRSIRGSATAGCNEAAGRRS